MLPPTPPISRVYCIWMLFKFTSKQLSHCGNQMRRFTRMEDKTEEPTKWRKNYRLGTDLLPLKTTIILETKQSCCPFLLQKYVPRIPFLFTSGVGMTHQNLLPEYTHPQGQRSAVLSSRMCLMLLAVLTCQVIVWRPVCNGTAVSLNGTCPLLPARKSYKLYAILNNYPYFKNSETNLLWGTTSEFLHWSVLILNLCLTFKAEMCVMPDTINLPMYLQASLNFQLLNSDSHIFSWLLWVNLDSL
jgi:hypothetical protein